MNRGFSVFYVKHTYQEPFFLIGYGEHFAEAYVKEEAVKKLERKLLNEAK